MWQKKQQPTFFSEQFKRLVPATDKFRIIKEKINFSFINELSKPLYGDVGPLGYVPDKLFRMLVVMYLENIPSERKLEERLRYDIRYRYFCDLDIMDEIPDHATFSVFRSRLGDELFKEIFEKLLEMIFALGFKKPKHISIDSTAVIADCAAPRARKSKKSNQNDGGPKAPGTVPRPPADPDARWGVKGNTPSHFGYKSHHIVDSKEGLILGTKTTPANQADVDVAKEFLPKTLDRHSLEPLHLAADKAYNSPDLRDELKTREIGAVIPRREGGRKILGGFKISDFTPDGFALVCPEKKLMKRYDAKGGGVVFEGTGCIDCLSRHLCTKRSNDARRVTFGPNWQSRLLSAQFEKTDEFKELYKQRGSVERVNSEAKRQHGLYRARYRGLEKVAVQSYLTAIVINLKRAAGFLAKAPPKPALARLA